MSVERRLFSLLLSGSAAVASGCSDGAGDTAPGAGAAGAAGTAQGSGGASNNGGNGMGTGGTTGFAQRGVCGQRGESPVSADSFEGYEEYYLIGERGFGVDICVVRFSVTRVGEAPAGCEECAWTHRVEYGNPEVLVDVDGVCANSDRGMDDERIAEIDGSQASYGFVYEYAGHVSVLLKFDEATNTWQPNGNANWSEETGLLRFDSRDGVCGYGQ